MLSNIMAGYGCNLLYVSESTVELVRLACTESIPLPITYSYHATESDKGKQVVVIMRSICGHQTVEVGLTLLNTTVHKIHHS